MIINLENIMNSPCSFFVICSATSKTQIDAIASNIEKNILKQLNLKTWMQEGKNSNWRLIDYCDIIVHIFKEDTRKHYNLEELWQDAEIEKIK